MSKFTFALDCTNGNLTFAIFNDDTIIIHEIYDVFKQVVEYLPITIDNALKNNNLTAFDFDKIICVAGPGGFAGVRTGTSFIEGIAAVTGVCINTISSLDALALSVMPFDDDAIILSVLNAKRGAVYMAAYDKDYNILLDKSVVNIDDVTDILDKLPKKPYHIAGHGFEVIKDFIKMDILSFTHTSDAFLFGKNYYLVCAQKNNQPIYLRSPDAVASPKKFNFN